MSINRADLHRIIDALPEEFLQLMVDRPDMALGEALNCTAAASSSQEKLQGIAQTLINSRQK